MKLKRSSKEQSFNFDFHLRYYQIEAIKATEKAIVDGQQSILLAMATGTGKTKTAIALIYRLLQAQRFRRILFLVDRSCPYQKPNTPPFFYSEHKVASVI